MLADQPTGNLDSAAGAALLDLFGPARRSLLMNGASRQFSKTKRAPIGGSCALFAEGDGHGL
jgi:hypothetical protein